MIRLRRAAIAATAVAGLALAAPTAAEAQAPHGEHGTPAGWKFTWPGGDPIRGRAVFVQLECYSCHEVKGERFPAAVEAGKLGPELSMMGALHEAEYFAESIVNPSAVVEKEKGYEASDGSSKMPSFNGSVTVQEVIDLVAYLRTLRPPGSAPAGACTPPSHP